MKKYIFYALIFFVVFSLFSCDDQPKPEDDVVIPPPVNGSVLINNEGNFNQGNSTLTVLNFADGKLYQDVFAKNNDRPLGDVFQSITAGHGKLYFVVNNSKKIEVIDPSNYKSVATITGFTSPRYMTIVNTSKAYVSEYYANAVRIVDLNTNTITGTIPITGWTEEMTMLNGKVYVANVNRDYIYIINSSTDMLEDSIEVIAAPVGIQVDAQNKIWVLSNGKDMVRPALQCINPATNVVEKNFSLTMAETSVSRLRINKAKDRLYWLSKHIYSMGIGDANVSSSPFIRSLTSNYYGLGVDPRTDEIYVSDVKDYVQLSNISRFSNGGTLSGDFTAGIIAGDFFFYYP